MTLHLDGNIFFTGFMATGKSRIGELVATALNWSFIDTDVEIEKRTGLSISEIFAEEKEEGFRARERELLKEICQGTHLVVALGGGTLTIPENFERVKKSGKLVCLWASPKTILQRVNRKDSRPLLSGLTPQQKLEKINELLAGRESIYNQADLMIESREDIPHHAMTRKIIRMLQLEKINQLKVGLGERSYPIYIGENILDYIHSATEKNGCSQNFVIVTDQNLKAVRRESLKKLKNSLGNCKIFFFRPGEDQKNLKSLNKLFTFLIKNEYSRKTTLIAFSGGVVGDMTGFAAAAFLRGVDFVQIPTTLLAMVDSSVGGKTGVNHPMGKNLIGAFYQPKLVFISLEVLDTLPDQEFKAGMAEVIKYAMIYSREFFDFLEQNCEKIMEREPGVLSGMIEKCCAIKAEVVEKDEKESGLRGILNYGHTFGHALEAHSEYSGLPHGYGVALGMRAAARLAVTLGMFKADEESRQNNLIDKVGLPSTYSRPWDEDELWNLMGRDKKVESGSRKYILPTEIGKVEFVRDVKKDTVIQAFQSIKGMQNPL